MKKTCKLLGTLALSAALCAGCMVPAFATPTNPPSSTDLDKTTDTGDPYTPSGSAYFLEESEADIANGESDFEVNDDGDNLGSTDVSILAEVGQISATIPIKVSIVAQTTGGDLLATPSGIAKSHTDATSGLRSFEGSGYRIENWSPMPIAVEKVMAASNKTSVWVYEDTAITDLSDRKGGSLGAINLKIASNIDESVDGWQNSLDFQTITQAGTTLPSTSAWSIAKKDDGGPQALGLKLWGNTSYINSRDALVDTDSKDIKLTYTIGIAVQS